MHLISHFITFYQLRLSEGNIYWHINISLVGFSEEALRLPSVYHEDSNTNNYINIIGQLRG